jgi:4,5-dihydroxyphthalate decarboxylase
MQGMPDQRSLKVYCADYEHCQNLSGSVGNVTIDWEPQSTKLTFPLALKRESFEVSEFSLSNYIMFRSRGADWLTALPIFPYRRFRHANAYVTRESSINSPAELRGRRIGVPDYSMTAAVWIRGIFQAEFGLDWRDLHWVSGMKQRFPAPAGAQLERTEANLEELLAEGDIDALWTPDLSYEAVLSGRFRTIFNDPYAAETAFYAKTGVYPPNHVMVVNLDVVKDPIAIAPVVFEAFTRAKWQAYTRRLGTTLLPWGEGRWNEAMRLFNANPLPYGACVENEASVAMLSAFLVEQGLVRDCPGWADLFIKAEYPPDRATR